MTCSLEIARVYFCYLTTSIISSQQIYQPVACKLPEALYFFTLVIPYLDHDPLPHQNNENLTNSFPDKKENILV